ncbi:MAG: M23B-like protein peptidase [Parcubacteria group bacterium GW2011_GWE1_43_8]|nr:MAG: M23B-like protein peptidase [Parcubacteria group bacterium GW2011_GWE1_43_8]
MRKFATAFICLLFFIALPVAAVDDTVIDLNNQIQTKQQELETLKKRIETYQNAIVDKQNQVSSLRNQLNILDDKIEQAALELEANELKLNTVTLQIQAVTLDIAAREADISQKKSQISELVRQLYQADQKTLLEVLVLNSSLGAFFDQLNYLEELEKALQNDIADLKIVKAELVRQQQNLASYRVQLVKSREEIELAKANLESEQQTKALILQQTRQSENRYQTLLAQTEEERTQANREVAELESEIRNRLQLAGPEALAQLGDTNFIWPVTPNKGISTYFYDPTYIFRRYFEHPAIDIPKPQGTAIKAAASGYVARAKAAGLGYSYIMLVHKDGFATVYGHVSRIDVEEGTYVTKGQTIGAVGGLPGTSGAGRLTTGPHLHFEIRSNGIPVNPLEYLP